jgi:Bax protein
MTDKNDTNRPTTGVFSVVREKWLAGSMLGLGLFTAALWAFQPGDEGASITATLRKQAEVASLPVVGVGPAQAGTRQSSAETDPTDTQVARFASATVDQLESRFERHNYTLETVRADQAEVPRIVPQTVPSDLKEIQQVDRKKQVFLQMVLPLVLMVNERLTEQRDRLQELSAMINRGEAPAPTQQAWLDEMYASYKVDAGEIGALIKRVDVVPPSLALAQAAIESGWGTSRFAREGNALFGQWVWGDDAKGIVPEGRESGKTHKVRAFDTPLEAVAAYIKNLNTHRAYRKLRTMRSDLRDQGAGINGLTLAGGLEAYSEKGMAYVKLVRGIISANELRPLDRARLAGSRPPASNV